MLTNKFLIEERPHLDGVQRLYDIGKGYKLSLVNAPMLHSYPFAWEAAVLDDEGVTYDTPLTTDVEVFDEEGEANEFIFKAIDLYGGGK